MPFTETNVAERIEELRKNDPSFKEAWDSSRMEYHILGELIRSRKAKGMSQRELAKLTGFRQQAISRIEKKEHSPTLKSVCAIANALDMELRFVPK